MGMYEYLVAPVDLAQVQRISDWVYDVLDLDAEIVVTIRQSGSSYAIETVIAVMGCPMRIYRIPKAAAEIDYADVVTTMSA